MRRFLKEKTYLKKKHFLRKYLDFEISKTKPTTKEPSLVFILVWLRDIIINLIGCWNSPDIIYYIPLFPSKYHYSLLVYDVFPLHIFILYSIQLHTECCRTASIYTRPSRSHPMFDNSSPLTPGQLHTASTLPSGANLKQFITNIPQQELLRGAIKKVTNCGKSP